MGNPIEHYSDAEYHRPDKAGVACAECGAIWPCITWRADALHVPFIPQISNTLPATTIVSIVGEQQPERPMIRAVNRQVLQQAMRDMKRLAREQQPAWLDTSPLGIGISCTCGESWHWTTETLPARDTDCVQCGAPILRYGPI